MINYKQSILFALYHIRTWKRNPRIIIMFVLCALLSFISTEEYLNFATSTALPIHLFEPYIVMFSNRFSMIYLSLILLAFFNDIPCLDQGIPYYLHRSNRHSWLIGQILYLLVSIIIINIFILLITSLLVFRQAYVGNVWSRIAVFSSYSASISNLSTRIAENLIQYTTPYSAFGQSFLLIACFSLTIGFILLLCNLYKKHYIGVSIIGLVDFSSYISLFISLGKGSNWFNLLSHATLSSHNLTGATGTGLSLVASYTIFLVLSIISFSLCLWQSHHYQFVFRGELE